MPDVKLLNGDMSSMDMYMRGRNQPWLIDGLKAELVKGAHEKSRLPGATKATPQALTGPKVTPAGPLGHEVPLKAPDGTLGLA